VRRSVGKVSIIWNCCPKGSIPISSIPRKRDVIVAAEAGAGPEDPVAIYVGRIAAEKNIPLVIRAMESMGQLHPGFKGVLVGEGPKLAELGAAYPQGIFVRAEAGRGCGAAPCIGGYLHIRE